MEMLPEEWLNLSTIAGLSPRSYGDEEEKKLKAIGSHHEIDGGGSSSDSSTQELVEKRLSEFKKWESALQTARGSTKEWLSLSIPGSSSSSYQKPKTSRTPDKIAEALSIGSSGHSSTSPVSRNQMLSTSKNSKASDISRGLSRNSNLPTTDLPSFREEGRGEWTRKNSQKHDVEGSASNDSASVESFLPFKKRKLGRMMISGESSENVNEQEEDRRRMAGGGWMVAAFRMGVSHPEFCLHKRVTQTDTEPNQNRFQLTKADITKSSPCLKKLAKKADEMPPPNGVPVNVMDRTGRIYGMTFKYLESSHTYRFMGAGYAEFLRTTGLEKDQIIDIWSLPRDGRGSEGDHWLAFIQWKDYWKN